MPTETVASQVPFSDLCGMLEKINSKQGGENKKNLLKTFIDKWREFHAKLHEDTKSCDDSFFPAMRLILPQLDKQRTAYGIKENTLARMYIEILCLGKDSPDAQKLLNYKTPKSHKTGGNVGDFAHVAYYVLKTRCPAKGTLTVEDVNECLTGISINNASKNKAEVRRYLLKLLRECSAMEGMWLIRMILKEARVGLNQTTILALYHPDAEEYYNVCANLEKVCKTLLDPTVRGHEIAIEMFVPFKPMLGERAAPTKILQLMDNKPFYIETKFDGERMQVHKDGDNYKYFSRGTMDFTAAFGPHSMDGSLTPYIHHCFKPHVKSCILDGEMCIWDPILKIRGSKGENIDVKSDNLKGKQTMLCVFDILYLNGKVLTNEPVRERLKMIEDVFTPAEGRIHYEKYSQASTVQECIDALNDAIDCREEGIMVKNPESIYKPNVRKGGWFKIKPEYVGGLMDELDLVIVGGNWGKGHRRQLISHFLLAVAVPPDDGGHPTEFHSFCRVGSGYSNEELLELNKKLINHWRTNQPASVICPSGAKDKPDVWIEPSKSFIVQVKAAEIVSSDCFQTGCTLRFPRVQKIRDDKNWYECMITTELQELNKKGKLTSGYAQVDDEDNEEPEKKRRRTVVKTVKPTVSSKYKGVDVNEIKQISELFVDKEFCVINGPDTHPKSTLEKQVLEYGGTIAQHPGEDTFCVLADKVVIKVGNIIKTNKYNVVKVDWFLKCVEARRCIPWIPSDMIHASRKTQGEFSLRYDTYGDSYFEPTTPDQLRKVFDNMSENKDKLPALTAEEIAEIELEHFPGNNTNGLFRTIRIYVDDNLELGNTSTHIKGCSLELVSLELELYGAVLKSGLEDTVSHVIVDPRDLTRVSELREIRRKSVKKFHILTMDWVTDCINSNELKREREYEAPVK